MRTHSNKKIHKIQKDPYKLLQRVALILAVAIAAGVGVFYLCSVAVTRDYVNTRDRILAENIENEAAFNADLAAKRAQNAALKNDAADLAADDQDLSSWEAELNGKTWRVQDEGRAGLENTSTITLERHQLINGGLLLVNAWHSIPSDFSEEGLVSVGTTGNYKVPVHDGSVRLFQPAFEALVEALQTAKEEAGLEHYIVMEGYRSVADQQVLFNEKMEKLSSRYSNERLIAETKKEVNYPGTSDYHTGMSFRMDVYQSGNSELNNQKFQAESAQGAWLTENCWRFGVAFRFPAKDFPNASWEDKSYKTGVSSNLNLYRYVGKAHAAAMKVMGFCLEEYIEFLAEHPHITIYEDGALVYEIVRIKGAESNTSYQLPVPNPAVSYQASLDNMDGIVMAYSYR